MKRKEKLSLHQKIHHHLVKHFHKHIHKVLHFVNHLHHHLNHGLELIIICIITFSSLSLSFADLTGLSQNVYTNTPSETATRLLDAIQNPITSLKQGNIISIRTMNMDVENSFAKWYCTYGAARISPEFFPFIDDKTQQRTWWGNAVDRCQNASDTWYKIWTTPSQWALIVYDAWGRFGSYGHVGKVMHYDKTLKKIIVRDMSRVWRGEMSDHREDLTTAQVKCYIYNIRTNTQNIIDTLPVIPESTPIVPVVVVPTVPISPVVIPTESVHDAATTTPTATTTIVPATTTPITPVTTETRPAEITTVTTPQDSTTKKLILDFENLSNIAKHFLTQNNLEISLTTKSPLQLGDVANLKLEIKDKDTGEPFDGLLPFAFSLLSTNDSVQTDISNIQMINNWSINVSILGQKPGTATMVINMDDTKIGEFSLDVK